MRAKTIGFHRLRRSVPLLVWALTVGCEGASVAGGDASSDAAHHDVADASDLGVRDASVDAAPDVPVARLNLVVQSDTDRDPRFVTMEHMLASMEMQHSGEPLAEAMGRDLAGYDRFALPTDLYTDPAADGGAPVRDLVGYSSAVESYEYCKVPMNTLAFESTAGSSMAHSPLVNPRGATGADAMAILRELVQRHAVASHAGVRTEPGAAPVGFVTVPAPTDNPLNVLGFGGFWPTVHPFAAFDPTITASRGAVRGCSLTGGYGASAGTAQLVGDYECGYSSLHLVTSRNDALSTERVMAPGASSWASWKYALWVINYLQSMHDTDGNAIESVPESELANVGREANTVRGTIAGGGAGVAGTWLGSTDLEGFQAAFMLRSVDGQAHDWITRLSTVDGATLSGFASVRDALAYDWSSPLRWIPAEVRYDEVADATWGYHQPTRLRVGNAESRLLDLAGLLGAHGESFALTDRNNREVGGSQPVRAYYDGDPFVPDNQMPDGEDTQHDRALAVLKLALVNLDRLHRDPTSGYLVDTVTFAGATPTRAPTATPLGAAYAVVSLRLARRALGGTLTLYSNSTPDTAVTRTALDGTSMQGAPSGHTIAQRLTALIQGEAELLYARLTDDTGRVAASWNVTAATASTEEGDLIAYAAAVRGLLEASLSTGDTRYLARAERAYRRMDSVFYSGATRMWRSTASPDAPVEFTPLRFGVLQGALREVYKLLASAPGREAFARTVEERLARLNKLVLNGWDDRDDDGVVDWPSECAFTVGTQPRGGLQMAERALTGETGVDERGNVIDDRDHDCVPEISAVNLSATLAARIRFTARSP